MSSGVAWMGWVVSDLNDCSRTLLDELESCSVSPWISVVPFTSDTRNDCMICGSANELVH